MPHDQAEGVVSSSLQHVTTWSTRVSSFQPVSTQNTQEGCTHLTGSTWNQGAGQEERYEGPCYVCLQFPHRNPHGSEESSRSSGGVLIVPDIMCQSRLPGFQTRVREQAYSKTAAHCIHTRSTLVGPDWQELEMKPSLKRAVLGNYWKLSFNVTGTHSRNGSLSRTEFWQSAGSADMK